MEEFLARYEWKRNQDQGGSNPMGRISLPECVTRGGIGVSGSIME